MSFENITPNPPSQAPAHTPPQSRKQKRLSKHLQHSDGDHDKQVVISSPSSTNSRQPKSTRTSIPRAIPAAPSPTAAPTMVVSRLLIASIGNPAPYLSTLHSAGHTVLFELASTLGTKLNQSPDRAWSYGLLAPGPERTLWMCPSVMNNSGAAVAKAWFEFLGKSASAGEAAASRLVVLHDELEAPLGDIRVRSSNSSAKGHNGLKNIKKKMPGVQFTRIGIGVGRPGESRDPTVVAEYLLRDMMRRERVQIESTVGLVMEHLERLGGEPWAGDVAKR